MADFRRCFLALAVLVLIIGSVAPASAQVQQSFGCVANAAVPPTLRAEGLTELTGDIVLNCTGGTPATTGTIPTANITVFLTNPVTSRIMVPGSPAVTEALLLVDEPSGAQQKVCASPTNPTTDCANTADGGTSFATNGNFNVYQGILTGPNAVTFLGVPIDAPATAGAPARVYRITNIRANVTTSPATCVGVCQVQAFISASGSTSMPINNPTPIVGFIAKGLNATTTLAGANGFLQCQNTSSHVADLVFTENFATAFKIRDASFNGSQLTPGAIYNTESGLLMSDLPGVGLADMGTRLKATFSNLPQGITLTVPNVVTDGVGGTIVLVGSTDYTPDPATYAGPVMVGSNPYSIPITYSSSTGNTGSATVVYEVSISMPSAIDSFTVPVTLSYTGAPGNPGTPTITGTGPAPSVILSFAPSPSGGGFDLTTGGTAQAEPVPIPRFIDNVTSTNLFTVSLCQTILLFPYVTDFPGFDTGIAISNTSMDPLATAGLGAASPQTGACSVTFYGGVTDTTTGAFVDTSANINGSSGSYSTTGANTFNTGMVGPGQTWAFAVSAIDSTFGTSGFQGFVGYAIAVCNFQYAHGYSFVSDYGLRNFAAAYLALIIPDNARTPTPNICSALGANCLPSGEQLVH